MAPDTPHAARCAFWYRLGRQPAFRNPLARNRLDAIRDLRSVIDTLGGIRREDEYFSNCWVLEQIDGTPLREFISCFIVPAHRLTTTKDTVDVSAATRMSFQPRTSATTRLDLAGALLDANAYSCNVVQCSDSGAPPMRRHHRLDLWARIAWTCGAPARAASPARATPRISRISRG